MNNLIVLMNRETGDLALLTGCRYVLQGYYLHYWPFVVEQAGVEYYLQDELFEKTYEILGEL